MKGKLRNTKNTKIGGGWSETTIGPSRTTKNRGQPSRSTKLGCSKICAYMLDPQHQQQQQKKATGNNYKQQQRDNKPRTTTTNSNDNQSTKNNQQLTTTTPTSTNNNLDLKIAQANNHQQPLALIPC